MRRLYTRCLYSAPYKRGNFFPIHKLSPKSSSLQKKKNLLECFSFIAIIWFQNTGLISALKLYSYFAFRSLWMPTDPGSWCYLLHDEGIQINCLQSIIKCHHKDSTKVPKQFQFDHRWDNSDFWKHYLLTNNVLYFLQNWICLTIECQHCQRKFLNVLNWKLWTFHITLSFPCLIAFSIYQRSPKSLLRKISLQVSSQSEIEISILNIQHYYSEFQNWILNWWPAVKPWRLSTWKRILSPENAKIT